MTKAHEELYKLIRLLDIEDSAELLNEKVEAVEE